MTDDSSTTTMVLKLISAAWEHCASYHVAKNVPSSFEGIAINAHEIVSGSKYI